ncbi:MAG TPA: hypothetical protein PKE43_19180, partial [Anaerolineales bacterium]|nr:hypothetical protein [Anaerolineales bacterium]
MPAQNNLALQVALGWLFVQTCFVKNLIDAPQFWRGVMPIPLGTNDHEIEILRLLEDLPVEVGIPEHVRQLLLQAGQSFAMKTALAFLASTEDKKKSTGAKIAMFVDAEENVELILPLLDETNTLLRWQAVDFITRTRKFLEGGGVFVDRITKALLEDS